MDATFSIFSAARCWAHLGLRGSRYVDKVDGRKEKQEVEPELRVEAASAASGGFVDRVYHDTPRELVLVNKEARTRYAISQAGFADTVVFNPWEEGKKGEKGPDFDDDRGRRARRRS
eukprot:gene34479-19949_t